jgi:radical SAM superfamily enzyme YgiQ (UPF0313 family)
MSHIILVGGITDEIHGRALGPYRLRTALEYQGHTCDIIDYSSILDIDNLLIIISKLINKETVGIGFSNSWIDTDKNKWLTNTFFYKLKVKYPSLKIILGGTKDLANDIIIQYVDWYITGFSDLSLPLLLDKLSGKQVSLKYFKKDNYNFIDSDIHYPVKNVNQIETVFKLADDFKNYQPITFEVSRGCIFKCSFCTHPFLGKKDFDYIRTPESIASELKRNYELFGTYRYIISDDTFNDSIEKLERFRKGIDLANLEKIELVSYIRGEMLVTKPEMIPILKDIGLKGAHFGIESLNNDARKSIGKGMEISRVLDKIREANSLLNLHSHASFILGLYNDGIDDFYKFNDFLVENKDNLFRSWRFNSLGLRKNPQSGISDIEKNPGKYQYTIKETNSQWLDWVNNKGVSKQECIIVENELNKIALLESKVAGFYLSSAWYHNVSDKDINTKTLAELNFKQLGKVSLKTRSDAVIQHLFLKNQLHK